MTDNIANLGRFTALSKLLKFAKPERRRLIWGTVCLAISSALTLIFPQAVREALDQALNHGDVASIDRIGLTMMAILITTAIASAGRYYLFTYSGERTVRSIKAQLFRSLLRQEIGFFDSQMTGDLLSRLTTDASVLQNALSVNISMLLRNVAATIGGLVLMIITAPKLTLVLLAALPPAAVVVAKFGGQIRGTSRQVQEALGIASAVADETLTNIRTVRSFAAEETEDKRFGLALDHALDLARGRLSKIGKFMGLISLWGLTAIAAVLWYGARQVVVGELTIGTMSAYILYTLTVAVSAGTLGSLWTDFMSATGAAGRIFQILDRVSSLPHDSGQMLTKVDGDIQFRHVNFAYPTRPDLPVLQDINLDIRPGQIVAVVGASGSGKSTIAGLMQRFYDPSSGEVTLDGQNLTTLSGSSLRRSIGTVAQEPILMSTSIRDNIAYGRPDAPFEDIKSAAMSAHAEEFIQRFPAGYDTLVGERGVQLSGGQRQRIAIARAMLKDPKILILDEATSALDAESESLVQEALQRLMRGRTVLVIAHRLSTVRHADQVVVVAHGRIVQKGTHDELIQDRQGVYYHLVEKQMAH